MLAKIVFGMSLTISGFMALLGIVAFFGVTI